MTEKYRCGLDEVEKGDFEEIQDEGCLWNDKSIDTMKLDGHWYALYGYNGEDYSQCWEIADPDGLEQVNPDKEYTLTPFHTEVEEDEWETVGYKFGY